MQYLQAGFDPVTAGHVALFAAASRLADRVVVFANSDSWLTAKKGKPFMDQFHRLVVLNSIKGIDRAMPLYDDEDSDGTSIKAIKVAEILFPNDTLLFINGGDRGSANTPEATYAEDKNHIQMVYGVGGTNKDYSSSWLLDEWKSNKTPRRWGHYNVISNNPGCKVKELFLDPGKSISLQRHTLRDEYWVIIEGIGEAVLGDKTFTVAENDIVNVKKNQVHKLTNISNSVLKVVEVQTGDYLEEDDIIRYEDIEESKND